VSGHHLSAHRGDMPPWLYPRIETRRPARAAIVRIAYTTYSAATWISPIPWPGIVTAHHGRPSAVKTFS
jgi:hypothetical protein